MSLQSGLRPVGARRAWLQSGMPTLQRAQTAKSKSERAGRALSDRAEHVLVEHLLQRYGAVLDAPAIAQVLQFNSITALRKSIQRKQMDIPMMNLPNRRGPFVLAPDMARYLMEKRNFHGEVDCDATVD